MAARFHIKENGILDRSRNDKRLNPVELCNTLNALDCIADKNVDEYSYIKRLECENEQLKQQVQNIHKLINSKIQSARELGSVRTVIALKNLQRELKGDVE